MDGRDLFVYIVMLAMAPLFIAILVVALLMLSPVLLPLWVWDGWKKRHRG
jgi:hypothetical protein